jgi:hypothetical protein
MSRMGCLKIVFLNKLPVSVPLSSKFRKAATSLGFRESIVYIYGTSPQIVKQTAERVLCLKDDCGVVSVGEELSTKAVTSFLTSPFLQNYLHNNPQRRLYLRNACKLSVEESIALASYPDPLNVSPACTFADEGRAFVDTLAQRTTYFGVLVLSGSYFSSLVSKSSSFRLHSTLMKAISNVLLETTSLGFDESQLLLPLSAPAQRLKYYVYGRMSWPDFQPFTIASNAVTLVFEGSLPVSFHTRFLQASGQLKKLGLVYGIRHWPSKTQQTEVMGAIRTNSNLQRLELGCLTSLAPFWEELLEVIGSHCRLRSVIFWIRTKDLVVEQVNSLIPFLQKHSHLNISFHFQIRQADSIRAMNVILEPVLFFNRVIAVTRESIDDRTALLGAALSNWTAGQFLKTIMLLSENSDLLCSLLGDQPSSRRQDRRKRQRQH